MEDRPELLISHASAEQALAQAWKELVETISAGYIRVWFSSDESATGGITIGKQWLDEIYERISESHFVLAIQTPASAGQSGIMWECGAASGLTKTRGIIPIVYAMQADALNNPLKHYAIYRGDDAASVRSVCQRLVQKFQLKTSDFIYEIAIKNYLDSVDLYFAREEEQIDPPRKGISAEQVVVWRNRIETQVQSGRISELKVLRQMMYSSLSKPPLEFSLHDLLGRLSMQVADFRLALEEIDYALCFAPRDIPLLYLKALALVELKEWDAAKQLIEHVISLDANMGKNAEIASLRGRIYRERWRETGAPADLDAAIQAYYSVYQEDPDSYYTGINAAALALLKGDEAFGMKVAQEVLDFCQQLQQRQDKISYWIDFTAGEAYLALGETEKALAEYEKGFGRHPAPDLRVQDSVLAGMSRMLTAKNLPAEIVDELIEKVKSFKK